MMKKLVALLMGLMLAISMVPAMAEETTAWLPEWDLDADVVVVGFGPAGAMAAKAAQESGATALIVEKASKEFAGGSSRTSKGFIAPATAQVFYDNAMGRLSMEQVQQMIDEGNSALEWLSQNGLNMKNSVSEGYGVGFYQAIENGVEYCMRLRLFA